MKRIPLFFKWIFNWMEFTIYAVVVYGFLSICNWSLNMGTWTGFSRFVFAIAAIVLFGFGVYTNKENTKAHKAYTTRLKAQEKLNANKKTKLTV